MRNELVKNQELNVVPLPLPQEGFVRLPQVLYVLGISKTTFWDGIKKGHYPAPIKIGSKIAVWKVEDIRNLIEQLSNQV